MCVYTYCACENTLFYNIRKKSDFESTERHYFLFRTRYEKCGRSIISGMESQAIGKYAVPQLSVYSGRYEAVVAFTNKF